MCPWKPGIIVPATRYHNSRGRSFGCSRRSPPYIVSALVTVGLAAGHGARADEAGFSRGALHAFSVADLPGTRCGIAWRGRPRSLEVPCTFPSGELPERRCCFVQVTTWVDVPAAGIKNLGLTAISGAGDVQVAISQSGSWVGFHDFLCVPTSVVLVAMAANCFMACVTRWTI